MQKAPVPQKYEGLICIGLKAINAVGQLLTSQQGGAPTMRQFLRDVAGQVCSGLIVAFVLWLLVNL